MNFFKILFYGFLLYMLYRLVFHFIIPVYRTTRQVKKGFREMQERMNQHMHQQAQAEHQHQQKKEDSNQLGDYIDFEEVK